MRTPANIAGHPIHPMLVTIPIGLWVFSLVCDVIALNSATPEVWTTTALYALVGGIIGALLIIVAVMVYSTDPGRQELFGGSFVIEVTFPCALIGQRELSLSSYPFSPPLIASDFFATSVDIVTIRYRLATILFVTRKND